MQCAKSVDCVWNVMTHAQKPNFVFRWNGRVHLNRRGHQFSRLLAAEVYASAVIKLDTPCSEIVWRVLATQSIRHFPFTSHPCVTVCHHISTGLHYLFRRTCCQHFEGTKIILHIVTLEDVGNAIFLSCTSACKATWYATNTSQYPETSLWHK